MYSIMRFSDQFTSSLCCEDGTSVPTKSRGQEFGRSNAIPGRNVHSNQADPPKKSSWMLLQRWDKENLSALSVLRGAILP